MLINDASITGSLIVNASASFQNISVGGNIIPDETNIRNLGSTDKYFKEIYVSTGSINFVDETGIVGTLNAGTITAIQSNTSSANSRLDSIESVSASLQSFTASISETNIFTSSATARLNALETTSASIDTLNSTQNNRLGSLETISASNISRISALETTSASVDTLNTTQNTRLTNLEIKTGSLATTGSNTFIGTQTITGSLFISSNLIVQGTSSLQNITASAVSIGTNIINLNTANPAIRYAGLVIGDSGSVGGSGSFLYDSVQDEMLFIHRGDSAVVTSSVALMGPETYDNVGNETYPTLNIIQKGTGKEHLVDSCIFDNGTTVCINANLKSNSNACITSICSPNFIGGTIGGTTGVFSSTISGTDIYASNVSCSPVGCFTTLCTEYLYPYNISMGNTFIRANGNKLGIGTGNPLGVLSITGGQNSLSSLATYSSIEPLGIFNMFYINSGTYPFYLDIAAIGDTMSANGGSNIRFLTHCGSANATPAERMRITSCGNVVIGNTTPLGGLTVSEFIANDCNDSISLFYRGTTGAHESLVKFYDFRCQINASIGNNLHDDTPGSPRARLVFKTSNGGAPIERMRIDACGIITAPSQVSFKAYISANVELSKSTNLTVPYNIEEYDTQGNYNTSTYKFTAPVAGKYLFTVNFNAYSLTDTAYLRVMLMLNASTVRTLFLMQNLPTGNTGDVNVSGADILNLAAGNTVEVRVYTDGSGVFGMSQNLDWNSFSGHLLG